MYTYLTEQTRWKPIFSMLFPFDHSSVCFSFPLTRGPLKFDLLRTLDKQNYLS